MFVSLKIFLFIYYYKWLIKYINNTLIIGSRQIKNVLDFIRTRHERMIICVSLHVYVENVILE